VTQESKVILMPIQIWIIDGVVHGYTSPTNEDLRKAYADYVAVFGAEASLPPLGNISEWLPLGKDQSNEHP